MVSKSLLTAAALAFHLAGAQAQEAAPISFTIAGPITGPKASEGEDMMAGARAAALEINARGGILGRRLILTTADDACDPRQGVSAANKVVSDGGRYIIGPYCSPVTKPASEIYDESGAVQITLSQATALTDRGFPRFFRMTPSAAELAKGYYDTITQAHARGTLKIALIGQHSDLSHSLIDPMKEELSKRAIPLTYTGTYEPDATDYSAVITRMRSLGVTMVVIAGSDREMGMIVRQAEDQGFKPRFMLSSTAASATFAGIAGCSAAGTLTVAAWNPLYFAPVDQTLLESLRAQNANGIDTAINAYSAVQAMAQAIGYAGKDDPEAVARALHTQTFTLPLGPVQFTGKGELANPRVETYVYQSVGTPCRSVRMAPAARLNP